MSVILQQSGHFCVDKCELANKSIWREQTFVKVNPDSGDYQNLADTSLSKCTSVVTFMKILYVRLQLAVRPTDRHTMVEYNFLGGGLACVCRQTVRRTSQSCHILQRLRLCNKTALWCSVVCETVSTETQVEIERRHDVEVQTTLSVSPDSVPTSPRSPGVGAAVVGSQWPPYQQHQQMLQLLLLQRQQQRAPGTGRPPNAPPSPRSPAAPGIGGSIDKPRKGSAPECGTDIGRALCVSAAAANSAFRPVLTSRASDWSPSRRTRHEPRLPYFEVRDVTGDAGKRFFRPIDDASAAAVTTGGEPKMATDNNVNDSRLPVTADSGACVNQISPSVRTSDTNVAGTSGDVPADTVTKTKTTADSRTVEPPASTAATKSYKTSSSQSRSSGTKLRRAYRSRTAELRLHRPPASSSIGSVSNSSAIQRHDRKWTADDEDDDALFSSDAGSVALSSTSARSRTKSDSSVAHSVDSAASQRQAGGPPVSSGSSSSLLAVARQEHVSRRRSEGWALDRGRPDAGCSEARSLRTSPFRQSPSPLIVRKLKSAAELLRESRRSRPASSTRLSVTITETSHCVTGTPPPSTAYAIPPLPSAVDSDPQTTTTTFTPSTYSVLQTSETTITSKSDQKTCDTGVDSRPTKTQSPPASTVKSVKSEFGTETTTSGPQPVRLATTHSEDAVHSTTGNTDVVPPSIVTTRSQTVETARGSRSILHDSTWLHVPKFFKTSK